MPARLARLAAERRQPSLGNQLHVLTPSVWKREHSSNTKGSGRAGVVNCWSGSEVARSNPSVATATRSVVAPAGSLLSEKLTVHSGEQTLLWSGMLRDDKWKTPQPARPERRQNKKKCRAWH